MGKGSGEVNRKLPARNKMVQLLTLYTDTEYDSTQHCRLTERDRQMTLWYQ